MFIGLVEALGRLTAVTPTPAGTRLAVATSLAPELRLGDSLAVNGTCLTVVGIDGESVAADVSPETARVTTLGGLKPGAIVNLERSMRADARIGGHFVQGHVDATGTIEGLRPEGESYRLTVTIPPALQPLIVHKGSIAIDGISLTIAAIDGCRVDAQIIPFTWQHTNLHAAAIGDAVNIECDILGKYVVRALQFIQV